MNELNEIMIARDSVIRRQSKGKTELIFPLRRGLRSVGANGLVVSSDADTRCKLADVLWECGVASVAAGSFFESALVLASQKVSMIVSQDYLPDAAYLDLLEITQRNGASVPVIVVSSTGDWPDYLSAMRAGAFDYIAYPPVPGDLQRAVRNALTEREDVLRTGENKCTFIR